MTSTKCPIKKEEARTKQNKTKLSKIEIFDHETKTVLYKQTVLTSKTAPLKQREHVEFIVLPFPLRSAWNLCLCVAAEWGQDSFYPSGSFCPPDHPAQPSSPCGSPASMYVRVWVSQTFFVGRRLGLECVCRKKVFMIGLVLHRGEAFNVAFCPFSLTQDPPGLFSLCLWSVSPKSEPVPSLLCLSLPCFMASRCHRPSTQGIWETRLWRKGRWWQKRRLPRIGRPRAVAFSCK